MILIASNNAHKIKMIGRILDELSVGYCTLADAGLSDDFEEEGNSLKEIAEGKAAHYSKMFNGTVVSTDGGVSIPALKDWNPLYTRRFCGKEASDLERIKALLELAKGLKGDERRFHWTECVAIAEKGEVLLSFEAQGDEGLLQESFDLEKREPGIWLCSLWHYPDAGKNFFDLTVEEKRAHAESSWKRIEEELSEFFN